MFPVVADSGLRSPITGIAGCCACAMRGHATAAPPSSVMTSRRLTADASRAFDRKDNTPQRRKLTAALRHFNPPDVAYGSKSVIAVMSAARPLFSQEQTFAGTHRRPFCATSGAIAATVALFDHLVCAGEQRRRNFETDSFC